MRAVVQRVDEAEVTVGGETVGRIGRGLLVYLGAGKGDGDEIADVEFGGAGGEGLVKRGFLDGGAGDRHGVVAG